MPTTYTTLLRLAKPATGELSGTWGDTVNANITTMVEQAIAGYTNITMTDTDYTLTVANGTTDEARSMCINVIGTTTATRNVICPTSPKLYFVRNSLPSGNSIVFKTAAGSGVTIPVNWATIVICDGTNVINGIAIL